jgi:hypothetical protein
MRTALRAAAAVLATVLASQASLALSAGCHPQALRDLQRLSPDGHAIYEAISDKRHFLHFLTCDDVVLGLATAVHESVHLLTSDKEAYPLIGGGLAARPSESLRFYAPRDIARRFDAGNMYVQTYLKRGAATSAEDFRFLLDELNAYSHDLATSVRLVSLLKPENGQVGHRDGLAALMTFVMSYIDVARERVPATWANLQRPEVKETVRILWEQAETALAASCNVPGFGQDDRRSITFLADSGNGAGLTELLGRAPQRLCHTPATAESGSSLTR